MRLPNAVPICQGTLSEQVVLTLTMGSELVVDSEASVTSSYPD